MNSNQRFPVLQFKVRLLELRLSSVITVLFSLEVLSYLILYFSFSGSLVTNILAGLRTNSKAVWNIEFLVSESWCSFISEIEFFYLNCGIAHFVMPIDMTSVTLELRRRTPLGALMTQTWFTLE